MEPCRHAWMPSTSAKPATVATSDVKAPSSDPRERAMAATMTIWVALPKPMAKAAAI